jgi:hypothetical protein
MGRNSLQASALCVCVSSSVLSVELMYVDPNENITRQLVGWLQTATPPPDTTALAADSAQWWEALYRSVRCCARFLLRCSVFNSLWYVCAVC